MVAGVRGAYGVDGGIKRHGYGMRQNYTVSHFLIFGLLFFLTNRMNVSHFWRP